MSSDVLTVFSEKGTPADFNRFFPSLQGAQLAAV
jgi:hypothetical protein